MNWFINFANNEYKDNYKKAIIIFPYAGGGAYSFKKWQDYFLDTQIYVAQYPGRENRVNEKPINNFDDMLINLYEEIKQIIDLYDDYYLLGHSLGTKFVYELALKIQSDKKTMPNGMIISAGKAPCFKELNPIHKLNDKEFIKEMGRFSDKPLEIMKNIEFMKIFLPTLKADFYLAETYLNTKIVAVESPIMGLMGTEDKELTIEELVKWGDYTYKGFSYHFIEGGHMFINNNLEKVVEKVRLFLKNTQNYKTTSNKS